MVGAAQDASSKRCGVKDPRRSRMLRVNPLGRRPWECQRPIAHRSSQTRWQLLLPPAAVQPLLWRQFRQLGLLPLQECADTECSSWLQHLQEKPVLLPAHLSLVEAPGWRQAALQAVPAPELLQESLWLLHRREDSEQERIQLLHSHLRERIRLDRAEQP